jgi:predicted 3-demethylubiquinone-9 3-methyltransferase (glyoxalase superfamily)
MPKLTPNLWFDKNAEDAANFYVSIFPNSRVTNVNRSPADFQFNESISFLIDCKDQAEVDRYWDALIAGGGEPSMCGWLKDRFGVSWQVVPRQLDELIGGSDPEGAKRAMEAMLRQTRLDVAELERAYRGELTAAG